jgi:hypothetical protein
MAKELRGNKSEKKKIKKLHREEMRIRDKREMILVSVVGAFLVIYTISAASKTFCVRLKYCRL